MLLGFRRTGRNLDVRLGACDQAGIGLCANSATSTTTSALGGYREIEGVPSGGVGRAQHR